MTKARFYVIPVASGLMAATMAVGVYAEARPGNSHPAPVQITVCHATQPVYTTATSGSAPVEVGSWEVTLRPGQSVLLPGGDTATCSTLPYNHGLDIS